MKFSLGGSYALTGIGVGLAVASWGTYWLMAAAEGLFWPVALAYWLAKALHHWAGG